MATYSFLNVNATLIGPGGAVNFGYGSAAAEEGISIEANVDKNIMTIGADGQGQNSLVADDSATITIRVLKTAPANNQLMLMYDLQSATSALWGSNVITITDSARGDTTIAQGVSFKKKPTITYAKEGGIMEWALDCIQVNSVLGLGL